MAREARRLLNSTDEEGKKAWTLPMLPRQRHKLASDDFMRQDGTSGNGRRLAFAACCWARQTEQATEGKVNPTLLLSLLLVWLVTGDGQTVVFQFSRSLAKVKRSVGGHKIDSHHSWPKMMANFRVLLAAAPGARTVHVPSTAALARNIADLPVLHRAKERFERLVVNDRAVIHFRTCCAS